MSVFAMVGVYLISVVDAYVDASLSEFDISRDLSMKVSPAVIKERSEYLLAEYGCEEYVGGKYSRIKFGIIRR